MQQNSPQALFKHIDNHPNTILNSLFVRLILIIFYSLGSILMLLGISFFCELLLQSDLFGRELSIKFYQLFEIPEEAQEAISNLLLFLGIICTSMGLLFLLIARLTRMILKRNNYLNHLYKMKDDFVQVQSNQNSEARILNSKAFIKNEIWALVISGAFQRSGVYAKELPDNSDTEKRKIAFKQFIRGKIEEIGHIYRENAVSDIQHIKNIQRISEETRAFGEENTGLLANDEINFGIAQKLLNLYLKYNWCIDNFSIPPPHFPVDRIIQERLNEERKKVDLSQFEVKPWTQYGNDKDYKMVIEAAKELLKKRPEKNIAELELELFGRR